MKLVINEKQLKKIVSKKMVDMKEQESSPEDAQPKSGTSTQQTGGQGYPEVGKWESGVTRGPSNQLGITKWSDIVGSTLKRGKSNPLK